MSFQVPFAQLKWREIDKYCIMLCPSAPHNTNLHCPTPPLTLLEMHPLLNKEENFLMCRCIHSISTMYLTMKTSYSSEKGIEYDNYLPY